MITVLGAGDVIANEVVKLFAARKPPSRLVARHVGPVPVATEMISADFSDKDQTIAPWQARALCIFLEDRRQSGSSALLIAGPSNRKLR
jgi:hypothetical protein